MAGDLGPVVQKLNWSHHHLTRLQEAIAEYIDLKPYVAIIKDEPEREGYSATVKLRVAPPPRIALLAGDALNSMHGALDYLSWQLVRSASAVPGTPTMFPIRIPNDDGSLPNVQIKDIKGADAISDQGVLDALDAVQPYKDGKRARDHPLFVLKRLNRETKHRHLPLLVASVGAFTLDGVFPLPEQIPAMVPLRDENSEQTSFISYAGEPNGRVPENPEVTPFIALEEVGKPIEMSPGLWDTLVAIFKRINEDVCPRFQPFF